MSTAALATTRTRLALVGVAVGVLILGAVIVGRGRDAGGAEPGVVVAAAGAGAPPPAADTAGGDGGDPGLGGDDAPAPTPLFIDLRPQRVGQGETMLVWVSAPGATAARLRLRDEQLTLEAAAGGVFWAVVGMPLDEPLGDGTLAVTATDAGGAVRETAEATYTVVAVDRPVDRLELTDEQSAVLTPEAGERERALRARIFAEFDRPPRWTGLFQPPLAGPITTAFGQGRSYNGGPVGNFHTGTDFGVAEGTAVRAPAAARVAWVGPMPIRGNSVILDHGAGVKTGYHHLLSASVVAGQEVAAGEVLGQVGSTGLSTGPHLHWELTVWGVNVDPLTWTQRDFTP